ncbi:hypothetical protein ACIRSU_34225 [Streptomyces sp. NPDC101160]|uniref:hypothetical protein n=1 Tax=Streptomyces sp. NPDC101160 TaxID=3366118 RepID=UPI003821585C
MIKRIASMLAVGLLATACGGGEQPEEWRTTAAQQCDDTLSPDGARALQRVLGTAKFVHDPRGGLDRVVQQLTEDHAEGWRRTPSRAMCNVQVPGNQDRIDISFGRYRDNELFGDTQAINLHPYVMGKEAQSGPKAAYLFVECSSPQLKGSEDEHARIIGMLRFNRSKLPDTPAVREANLTILHSVTLAVVKKLGCRNNAGLLDRPVLTPK